jgi:hypothetical protein
MTIHWLPRVFLGAAMIIGMSVRAEALQPLTYDCDTAAGSYSELSQPAASSKYSISGVLTARKLRTDERWAPSATVTVKTSDSDRLSLQLIAADGTATQLQLLIRNVIDGKESTQPIGVVPVNQAVPFTIFVDGVAANFEAGGRTFNLNVPAGGTRTVSVACSTGEFLFERLEFPG